MFFFSLSAYEICFPQLAFLDSFEFESLFTAALLKVYEATGFFGYSPAVSQKALQDVGGPGRAKDGPLDASVFEVAAVDLVGAEPLFDALLDAVGLGEAYRARTWREAVIHKVHRILKEGSGMRLRKRIRPKCFDSLQ